MKKKNPYTRLTGWLSFVFFILTAVFFCLTGIFPLDEEAGKSKAMLFAMLTLVCLIGTILCLILFIIFKIIGRYGKAGEKPDKNSFSPYGKGEFNGIGPGQENVSSSRESDPKAGESQPESGTPVDMLVYEKTDPMNISFKEAFLLCAYTYSPANIPMLVLLLLSPFPIVAGILDQSKGASVIAVGIFFAVSGALFLFLSLVRLPLSMVKAGKKNLIRSVTRIYQDRIVTEADAKVKGEERHVKQICYLSSFVRAKESKKAFYFVIIENQKARGIYLSKDELNEEARKLLSLKIREAKKK